MKTLLVCRESSLINHEGEEYDEYISVEDQPTTKTINKESSRIIQLIRGLWAEDCNDETSGENVVSIMLDGPSPYNAILIDVQISLKLEGIIIDLPYLKDSKAGTMDVDSYLS